ncbi:hypothetical protein MGYG_04949 [Nannizzia gypsea CBS 118893]|uniref:Uncharacterized protein n=1 Tax=Arthroderma gypseum (strain ATCC MYA-4604 / CBS 118893) TaxID=535722 RepID=E4UXQ3_ARTGP|nr:hypothetical protein MGYG_04949 [Nannizzia gypsea CBS 118893]EFR01948.1 hypothetical protein MGYG_04949 [Nannizzia gypsea CBS 118893]
MPSTQHLKGVAVLITMPHTIWLHLLHKARLGYIVGIDPDASTASCCPIKSRDSGPGPLVHVPKLPLVRPKA